jgi:hypothetical protein
MTSKILTKNVTLRETHLYTQNTIIYYGNRICMQNACYPHQSKFAELGILDILICNKGHSKKIYTI